MALDVPHCIIFNSLTFPNLLDLILKFLLIFQSTVVEHQLKFSAFLHAESELGRTCSILISFLRLKKKGFSSERQFGRRMLRGRKVVNFVKFLLEEILSNVYKRNVDFQGCISCTVGR